MTPVLSPNTQAILLLTAPLIAGRGTASSDLLSPGEYKRLARHLREIQRQPADLLSPDAAEILRACQPVIDESRLQKLLGCGFLLSQVIERWQARAIWVVSRADAEYPRRLKARLREDAPAVLYGCGDMALLEAGGLAVVGSRHVDDALVDYTMAVGRLAARAGKVLVSGGAKGVDQAAMRGALEEGGSVCGVMADSLERNALNRANRDFLLGGKLVLISPYDPSAGFNVGNAMQRNKLIYALADTSLVVSSDLNKGGTWRGAVEQLEKFRFVPVFVRSSGERSAGLDGLRKKGALPWPNPQDVDSFEEVFNVSEQAQISSPQADSVLFSNEESMEADATTRASVPCDAPLVMMVERKPLELVETVFDERPAPLVSHECFPIAAETIVKTDGVKDPKELGVTPAEVLFASVRAAIQSLLDVPMKDVEVAAALDVSNAQAKVWLRRLVDEGVLEKRKKPVGYVVKQERLFE